ncbi:asparagine synthase (glutamine-hydrolyzing) [Micromonospora sp. NPDC050980]|uniref:asparagine synthase (glutamine-hydrolyzing) n=1 Tax=Micromonospora sp. NPDC050980 TaxID=3155161 RepID=UPI0033ECD7DA
MCGVVGWLSYGVDLTAEGEVITAMTDTMACRGPDECGMWSTPRIALGHRRLAIIDLDGGRQPMVERREDGEVLVALTYSGEVYNYRELRRDLVGLGHTFRTSSDTEVVLKAYLAWGEGLVDRLNGMYAFAIWDARQERLLLVRDRLGIKPLYYADLSGGFLFGSEPKAILANPLFRPEMDEQGLRVVVSPVRRPGDTVWRRMREVLPGSVVTVDRGACRAHVYWRVQAEEHLLDRERTVAEVRGLLEDIVERQLIAEVPLCTLLSGGLDSSAITAIAAGHLRRSGNERVRSFSVDFSGHAERFVPDEVRPDPDAPFVRALAEHVSSEHTDVLLSNSDLIDPAVSAAVLRAFDRPPAQGEMSFSLYLLFRAIREKSTVALSGEAADEVFGGYRWFHDPAAVGADTFPWLASTHRFPRFSPLREDIEARLALDEHIDDLYRETLAEVPLLPGEPAEDRRMREVTYLHLKHYLAVLLERKDRLSMAVGLEVRVPFCDHRLVQMVYNVPWRLKTYDGREKSLLRGAVADLVPESVAQRRKSHYPTTQDSAYAALVSRQFNRLLETPQAPVFELVDHKKATWLSKALAGQRSSLHARRSQELVLAIHGWLEMYRPMLTL